MRSALAALLSALALTGACSLGPAGAQQVAQVVADTGPASIGPTLLVGASIDELTALIEGAEGHCGTTCWPQSSDPAVVYLAVVATAFCHDRDLASSRSGLLLTVTVTWKQASCPGAMAAPGFHYSLLSVSRQGLPVGPLQVAVRYGGDRLAGGPVRADVPLELSPAPAATEEQAAVAAALQSARADAGIDATRRLQLLRLYRLHCTGGADSYVVQLVAGGGGSAFMGQYVDGARPAPSQGCPAP